MKIVYRYQKYNVSFLNAFKFGVYRVILFFRRLKRFIKRLLQYSFRSIPVMIVVLPIVFFLIWYGLNHNIFESLLEGLCDIATTIIIPYFTFVTISEINRNKALKEQRNLYELFVYESSSFLENLGTVLLLGNRMEVSFDDDSFLEEIKTRKFNRKSEIKKLIMFLEMYCRTLDNTKGMLGSIELIGRIKDDKYRNINYLQNEIMKTIFELKNEKYRNEEDYWKSYLSILFRAIYPICSSMRDPWRLWDQDINEKMKKCLSEKINHDDK